MALKDFRLPRLRDKQELTNEELRAEIEKTRDLGSVVTPEVKKEIKTSRSKKNKKVKKDE